MTDVTLLRSGNGLEGYEVYGHCGYADAGYDIVCSAISALTQTTAMGLKQLLKLHIALEVEEGALSCILPRSMDDDTRRQAELLLETMTLGLRDIEESYGDYINITERTV